MAKQPDNKVNIRTLEGVVVSTKNDKTVVVEVESIKTHPKYGKQFKVNKRYMVHDESNECKVGDSVAFRACRPLSKHKKWRIFKAK